MNRILIILLVILILGTGVFFGFHSFQKYIESQGLLKVRVHPSRATLTINNKTFQNKEGLLTIRLNPGEYSLFFSCPDYSFWEENITIEKNKTTILNDIYLFPNNWAKENIISGKNIEYFYLSPDSNYILFLKKINDGYGWYVFNRYSKKKDYIFKSTSLPDKIDFSSKKILAKTKKNEWQIIFLPKSLIENNIPLNSLFKESLEQSKIKQKNTSLLIKQALFSLKDNADIIVRTNDAIYIINFLSGVIEKLYEGQSSPFIIDNDYIYFIKENGVFTKICLETMKETETSLYSFSLENLEQTKIKKKKNDDEFLIVEGSKKAYYLKTFDSLPELIGEDIIDSTFSLDEKEILLFSKDKFEIYNTENGIKTSKKFYSDVPIIWFLNNNFLLFLKDNMLKIYGLSNDKNWPIANNIKNNNFFYDSSINYIFYLSDSGIIKVSL